MKNITIWLAAILVLLPLTACAFTSDGLISSRLNQLNNSQTDDMATEQAENLLLLADQKNIDGIKEIFSVTAQNNGISNEAVQQLIDLFYDRAVSVERLGGSESSENNYGDLTQSYSYSFSVKTEHSEYILIYPASLRSKILARLPTGGASALSIPDVRHFQSDFL